MPARLILANPPAVSLFQIKLPFPPAMNAPDPPKKRGRGRPKGTGTKKRRTVADLTQETAVVFYPPGEPGPHLPDFSELEGASDHEEGGKENLDNRRDSLRCVTSLKEAQQAV